MKRKRYSDEQIAFALRQAESGTSVEEICRRLGVSEPTFYRWKKQFAGMGVAEIRRLKQLEEAEAEPWPKKTRSDQLDCDARFAFWAGLGCSQMADA